MLITSSRAASTTCWRYAFDTYHRNLSGQKTTALVDGGATHVGIAHGMATRDWDEAKHAAYKAFMEEIPETGIAPEDAALKDAHWALTKAIIDLFEENFHTAEYEVLQPECTFDVPLPGSGHNCIWLHWVDKETGTEIWGVPPAEKILAKQVANPHQYPFQQRFIPDASCPCYTPHRLAGQTDAIVRWHGFIWLMDHKTSSLGGDSFWNQWDLDQQGTMYIYGIWKSLGLKPKGFIINHLYRPSEKQVSSWNAKRKSGVDKGAGDYLKYERRPFLRTEEDLARMETNVISLCNEWERRIVEGDFRYAFQRGLCDRYNHRCEFFTPCVSHEEPGSFAGLSPRAPRYDDQKIQEQLIQIKEKICQ